MRLMLAILKRLHLLDRYLKHTGWEPDSHFGGPIHYHKGPRIIYPGDIA